MLSTTARRDSNRLNEYQQRAYVAATAAALAAAAAVWSYFESPFHFNVAYLPFCWQIHKHPHIKVHNVPTKVLPLNPVSLSYPNHLVWSRSSFSFCFSPCAALLHDWQTLCPCGQRHSHAYAHAHAMPTSIWIYIIARLIIKMCTTTTKYAYLSVH